MTVSTIAVGGATGSTAGAADGTPAAAVTAAALAAAEVAAVGNVFALEAAFPPVAVTNGLIVNAWVIGLAVAYELSPACDAVIEHCPADTMVIAPFETVQTGVEFEVNDTGRPELAVALSTGAGVPSVAALNGANVITLTPSCTVNVELTGVAVAYAALPT